MNRTQQAAMAAAFRARHREKPVLLLPNAWDGMSARVFAAAGFAALATTSGGVAWALGYPDGESAPWPEVVSATARIVRSVQLPVSADIEAGYAGTLAELAAHIHDIIQIGVVGINLEDGLHDGAIRTMDDAIGRLRAAREAANAEGIPICINARCDIYHTREMGDQNRFAAAVERCRAYIAAGADCVYPFGLRDAATIAEFVHAVAAPVNVTGRPGMPDAAVLERIGVARITVASAPALVAMSTVQRLATDLRTTGSFDGLTSVLRHPDAQKLFSEKP
jgi:2-methylisocitrate lyase-like PEP mutase family enzyme